MRNIFEKMGENYADNTYDNSQKYDSNKRFDEINVYLKNIGLNDEQITNVCQLIDCISDYSYDKGDTDGYRTAVRDEINWGD